MSIKLKDNYGKPNQHYLPRALQRGFLISPQTGKRETTNVYVVKKNIVIKNSIDNTFTGNMTYQSKTSDLNLDIRITEEETEFNYLIREIQRGNLKNIEVQQGNALLNHYVKRSILFRKCYKDVIEGITGSFSINNTLEIIKWGIKVGDRQFLDLFKVIIASFYHFNKERCGEFKKSVSLKDEKWLDLDEKLKTMQFQIANLDKISSDFKKCQVLSGFKNLLLSDCGLMGLNSYQLTPVDAFVYARIKFDLIILPVSFDKLLVWHNYRENFSCSNFPIKEEDLRQAAVDHAVDQCIGSTEDFPKKTIKSELISNTIPKTFLPKKICADDRKLLNFFKLYDNFSGLGIYPKVQLDKKIELQLIPYVDKINGMSIKNALFKIKLWKLKKFSNNLHVPVDKYSLKWDSFFDVENEWDVAIPSKAGIIINTGLAENSLSAGVYAITAMPYYKKGFLEKNSDRNKYADIFVISSSGVPRLPWIF